MVSWGIPSDKVRLSFYSFPVVVSICRILPFVVSDVFHKELSTRLLMCRFVLPIFLTNRLPNKTLACAMYLDLRALYREASRLLCLDLNWVLLQKRSFR